jgi:ferritin
MIGEKIETAFNEQINWELYSAYLYLSMSAYFLSINLNGFANWMRVQALEEVTHAMKFFDFINERSGRVALLETKAPPKDWESPLAAFEDAYEHECFVSSRINDLVNLSLDEKDHASNNFLQWFVGEQVEEEASVDEVAQKLKIIGGDGGGLFMLDQELGQRVFTPPAAEE